MQHSPATQRCGGARATLAWTTGLLLLLLLLLLLVLVPPHPDRHCV
jgi:hypothetical protein